MQVKDLYQKVGEFSEGLSSDSQALSHCQKGCSRCCYVDLSIFHVEADNIQNWFEKLPTSQQTLLKEKWQKPLKSTENFHQETVSSCAFLHEEACTIYEARPLICRSQGLAMKFKEEEAEYLDICPLNEDMLEELTEKEVLNLDLLNMILVQLEKADAENAVRPRIKLTDLRSTLSR